MDDSTFVFVVIGAAAVLFASDRVRMDFVAILVVLALSLGGILSPKEAFAGFGDPVVILVAGLMVVGEALDRTGVAQSLGVAVAKLGGSSRSRLTALIMVCSAALSSFMSSTAVVAIFIPIVVKISKQTGINASRLMLPMSYAAMISGMLTLIATMPNLVVSDALVETGNKPLSFFGFAPVGLCMLGLAVVYMVVIGDRILGGKKEGQKNDQERSIHQLLDEFSLPDTLESARVESNSSLLNRTIAESEFEKRFGVRILAIYRANERGAIGDAQEVGSDDVLRAGDVIVMAGESRAIRDLVKETNLCLVKRTDAQVRRTLQKRGVGLVMIHPNCRHVGKTISQAEFRTRYGIHVIGMQRGRERVANYAESPLQVADVLLVAGAWSRIAALKTRRQDFVLLELPAEHADARPGYRRAPIALAILAAMILASIFNLFPISITIMMAAVAAILTKCLTAADAYRAISWRSLVLLAGMLPVAAALEKTGGTTQISNAVVSGVGSAGPYVMISLLFVLAAGLSLVLSNTATAVVLAPVAIRIADIIDVSPYPLAVTVLIGASSAFASPVASPVVTLVVEPGNYQFKDFIKLGVPLMVIAFLVNLLITPLLYPL